MSSGPIPDRAPDERDGATVETGRSDIVSPPLRHESAERLRRLGHALIIHRPGEEILESIVTFVDAVLPKVTAASRRAEPLAFLSEPEVQEAIAAGDLSFLLNRAASTPMFEDSIVSGPANPLGLAATIDHSNGEVITRVALGPAFEGAPGRVHGGILAALFDETMGAVLPTTGTLAYTGRLTISFRRPAPVGAALEVRARVADRSERKITVTAIGTTADEVFAEATALFIAVGDLGTDRPEDAH